MTQKKLDNNITSGFKTPKDYFSKVEEQILNEVKVIDKAEHSGFEVPESYFEKVESNILDTIALENNTKVVSLISWKKVTYTTAIAACLVLMFNVFFNTSEKVTFESIEITSIENYIETEDYTAYELASLLTEDELNKDNFIDTEISETTLEDYLLDHVEVEDLILEQTQ
nr:hypothetical protein [uncultured Psychroserpens sp.]